MKIDCFGNDPVFRDQQRQDLISLLDQPTEKEVRPCANCTLPCPCSASPQCACACTIDCEHVPIHSSSSPDLYPIEPKIVSMVFSLNVLRVTKPCWSCEGHLEGNGDNVQRLPQVWFYSRSVLYPRLIAEFLTELRFHNLVHHQWTVQVLSFSDGLDTRFSITPERHGVAANELGVLQQESDTIARHLCSGIREKAQQYLAKL